MSIPMGAGAVVSTPTDLNIFYNALFDGKVVLDNSLSQIKKMDGHYGMGLFQMGFDGKKSFGHFGGIDGFSSCISYFPSDKVSIAFTSNALVMNDNDILIGALSIFFGREYKLPEFKPTLELSSTDLDVYLGTYSSPDFPFKITITKEGNVLIAKAPGQSLIPLECYEKDKFKFDPHRIKIHFLPTENSMILKEGRSEHVLTKEE